MANRVAKLIVPNAELGYHRTITAGQFNIESAGVNMAGPVNAAAALAKWKSRASNAGAAMTAGVQAVTVAPTQKAAAAVNKYAAGVQRAVQSGSYVNGLNAVSLQDWQQAMTTKGVSNYQNGINNISPKAQKAMADQQAYAAQVSATVASMPNENDNDAEQRALTAIRLMRQYGKS